MPEPAPLRAGVAGVGYLGQHHARVYTELPGVVLAGVYDTNPARAAEIAARHQCPVFDTVEALGKACQVVSVVVPTNHHCTVALPLLAAGCHLLIEKPLCATMEEAEKIAAAAQAAGRIVQVGHIEHFNPVMAYMEANVKLPRFIRTERLAPLIPDPNATDAESAHEGYVNPRVQEVDVVLDLMIHDIGLALKLVDSPVKRMDAAGFSVLTPHMDIANARLVFENGCVADLNVSRLSKKRAREWRIFQRAGYMSVDFDNCSGHFVRWMGMGLKREEISVPKTEPLKLELAAFVESVRTGQTPKIDVQFGKLALDIALKITAQIKAGGL
ncbi:MAG TPA: Gfo/Idh/MocA family oxidoreductase [Opitutales bacterium]|jgi:predicted dehydrogenase|nr:Gfo/Idh/MocA family oxidoreductase [Opitutales bacterium]